jgi:hypothetical protein
LAQWAIAYASHVDIFGEVRGVILLKLFLLNIQNLSEQKDLKNIAKNLNNLQFPQNLNNFMSRVKSLLDQWSTKSALN